jgi:hypothetical protein
MNWGKGIIIAMLLFMGFIGLLISMMVRHGDGLEETSYYEQGNKYDQKLQRLSHAAAPGKGVELRWDPAQRMVRLVFRVANLPDSGNLRVLRPSNLKKDFALRLNAAQDTQFVSWEGRQHGLWKFQCEWYSAGKPYLHEQEILIP